MSVPDLCIVFKLINRPNENIDVCGVSAVTNSSLTDVHIMDVDPNGDYVRLINTSPLVVS